jgi:tetratricopeptide (TPR) repeat protein
MARRRVGRGRVLTAAACFAAALSCVSASAGESDPGSGREEAARLHFDQGEAKREEGKWADAMASFARAVELDPGCYACHVRLQQASARAGAAASLAERYEKLAAERPDDPAVAFHRLRLQPPAARVPVLEKAAAGKDAPIDALRELGRAHLALGQAAQAKKPLEAAFARRPSDRELLFLSVDALVATGDVKGAAARLEEALKDDSELWDAHAGLARLHLLADRAKEAVEHADRVLALRPTHVAAMMLRAEGLSRLGKRDDAVKALDAALAVNPDDVEARIAWADLVARAGTEDGWKKALEAYAKALQADRGNARAHYGAAWVHERKGAFADAEKAYREALLAQPGDAATVNSLGLVLLRQKKFAEAVTQFKKAVDLEPQSPAAYLNLGMAFDEQAQWNEAIDWYAKCLKLKGQDKNVRALLMIAFDYEALGSYAKAEGFLEKVRAVRPDDAEVATYLGDNQFFQRKWKNAIKHYTEATRLDEKNLYAWRGLGAALSRERKFQEAVVALERARALKADDPDVLYLLGQLYHQELEDLEKALEAYQGYVKAGGTDASVPGVIEQIKQELDEQKR